MKIKIADKVYDSKEQPIMAVLSEKDKQIIRNMVPETTMYCCFPRGTKDEDITKWMEERAER